VAAPPITAEPGVRFGIANGVLVVALVAASAAGLDTIETAWAAALAAGLLGIGLSRLMTAWLGVIAWAMFTGFVENRFGELTFSDGDVRRLVVFTVAALALSMAARRFHHLLKENAHV
jgi:hypothetical protein